VEPEERIRELERALDAARRELSLAREEASKATFFKKLVESSTDMVSVIGADGKASYVSPAHERVTGHSLAEIVSGTALDTIHPDDRASIAAKMEEILAAPADRVLRAELRRHHKDGRWIHVETSARNMTDDPDVRGILVNGREIEDFVRMRQELRDTEARYEVAMLASRETIWEEDLASGAVSFSGGMGEQLGYPAAAFARTKAQLRALVHDDDRAVLERAEQRHLATGSLYDVEVRVRASTGEYRWYRIVGHVLCDEQGRKARLIGHAADVHDRKVAEIALHDSERMFRALFEDTSIAVTLRDVRSQKFIDCNSAALRLYGFASREELYDTTPDQLTEVTQPDGQRSVDVLRAYVQRAMRDGAARMEWVARRRTGEAFQAEVQTTVITLEGGARVMQTLIDDVTERTRVARALERRARRDEMVSRVSRLFVESGADVAIPFALGELGVLLGAGRVRMRQFVDGGAAGLA
jgi:PAS domain S-box-containing protein